MKNEENVKIISPPIAKIDPDPPADPEPEPESDPEPEVVVAPVVSTKKRL